MIIDCINCSKKFSVNSELIPDDGRTIQCGSCNHTWFFKKDNQEYKDIRKTNFEKKTNISSKNNNIKKKKISDISLNSDNFQNTNKSLDVVEYKAQSNFTFDKFLSYILVLIISFIALIIILDTFKSPLYELIPDLEFLLFSLFETLKDIKLFIKDLI